MKTAWRIFVRDLKRLAKNPVAVIITIGVAILPSLYAWFNIIANWDPYENTSTMPIAVVIEDKGAEVGSRGYTNAGDMIREELEDNTQLAWNFVDSEDEAVEGVKAGTYYAAFVVPEDFTESLADVLDGDTSKAHIAYYVNEKANAIAPKVTDSGSTTIENQIANEFVDVVGETVTEKLQGVAGDVSDSIDTTRDNVADNLREASTKLNDLADDLASNQSTLSAARSAISTARSSLSSISGTTQHMTDSLSSSLDGLSSTRTKTASLATQLSQALTTGTTAITGMSSQANYQIGQITGELGWAQGQLDGAITTVGALSSNTLADVRTSLERLELTVENLDDSTTGKSELLTVIQDALSAVNSTIDYNNNHIQTLKNTSAALKSANDSVQGLADNANSAIQGTASSLSDLQTSVSGTTMPALSSALDSFASLGGQMSGAVSQITPMLSQADSALGQLDGMIENASSTLGSTADSVRSGAEKVSRLADDVSAIESAESYAAVQNVLDLSAEGVGDFLGSPAELVSNPIYPVENYGSGVAPFYTNLAMWVGGIVLVAIYKLEVDTEGIGDYHHWQGFVGRWLLLAIIGQLQAVICCVGDLCLGIQCVSPAAFVFAGMVENFVYVLFIYALSIAFKHIGKALAVLLVVLQIPGASGTYPIEMMPDFFKALNPWLPFTYGINAMREAIAGFYGNYYVENLCILLVFIVPALLVGIVFRRHLLNINRLFDVKLGETDMMVAERTGMHGHFDLTAIARTLMDAESSRDVFLAKAAAFELRYKKLIRAGFVMLIVVPIALLALMLLTEAKFAMLVLWIISLVGICTYLIVVEYLHSHVNERCRLSQMDKEELLSLLEKGGEA